MSQIEIRFDITESGIKQATVTADTAQEQQDGQELLAKLTPELRSLDEAIRRHCWLIIQPKRRARNYQIKVTEVSYFINRRNGRLTVSETPMLAAVADSKTAGQVVLGLQRLGYSQAEALECDHPAYLTDFRQAFGEPEPIVAERDADALLAAKEARQRTNLSSKPIEVAGPFSRPGR